MSRHLRKTPRPNCQKLRRLDKIASPIIVLTIDGSPLYANAAAIHCLNNAEISDITTFIDGKIRFQIERISLSGHPQIIIPSKFIPGLQNAFAGFFDFESNLYILLVFDETISLIPCRLDRIPLEKFAKKYWKKLCFELNLFISDDCTLSRKDRSETMRQKHVCDKLCRDSTDFLTFRNDSFVQSATCLDAFIFNISRYINEVARKFRFGIAFESIVLSTIDDDSKIIDSMEYLLCFAAILLTILGVSSDNNIDIRVCEYGGGVGFRTSFETRVSCDLDEFDSLTDLMSLCAYFPCHIPSLICISTAKELLPLDISVGMSHRDGVKRVTFTLNTEFAPSENLMFQTNGIVLESAVRSIFATVDSILSAFVPSI